VVWSKDLPVSGTPIRQNLKRGPLGLCPYLGTTRAPERECSRLGASPYRRAGDRSFRLDLVPYDTGSSLRQWS
jgi:hypothetical protein